MADNIGVGLSDKSRADTEAVWQDTGPARPCNPLQYR